MHASPGPAPSRPSERRTVLFVDGDPVLRGAYEADAHRGGYEPLLAADAQGALQAFERHQPDCVVTDLFLPGALSGGELVTELRRSRLGAVIPILAVSPGAKSLRGVTDAVIAHDVDDYVEKPVHGERLLWRIGELLKGRPIGLVGSNGALVQEALRSVMLPRGTDFLQGSIRKTDLATLFFSFFATSRSGKLVVMRGREVRIVWFRRGFPVFAESNLPGEEIGSWLLSRELVEGGSLEAARAEWQSAARSLGVLLVARGATPARVWFRELRAAVTEGVDRLFGWDDGQYYLEYHPDSTTYHSPEAVSTWRSPAWFVVQGIRANYDVARCRALFDGSEGVLRVSDSAHFILRELEDPYYFENLFSLLDGERTAQEVLQRHPFVNDPLALSSLAALWVVGAVVEEVSRSEVLRATADPAVEAIRRAVASAAREHPDARAARAARVEQRLHEARVRQQRAEPKRPGVSSILGTLDRVSAEVALENGARSFSLRDYRSALREFREAAHLMPNHARAHLLAGQAALMLAESGPEELALALHALKKAVALEPDVGGHYHFLGLALLRLGYRDEARLTLRRSLELGSEHTEETRGLLSSVQR